MKKKKSNAPASSARPKKKAGKHSKPEVNPPSFLWGARHTWTVLGLILVSSIALGVICVFQFMDSPFFNLPIIDEGSYVNWAEEIASGEVLGNEIFYQDPLYPYFLALVFSVFGKNFMAVRLIQVVMGTLSIGFVFWSAKKLMGDKPALVAAGIMAAYRGLYFFELLLLKATLVIFLSALSCALGVAAADKPGSKWRWVGLGISLGLLTLVRGNFQAIIPFLVIWAFAYAWHDPLRARLVRAALFAGGICLIVIPVSIRNYKVAGEFVLTTSQGGANFYIGNNERANGLYQNPDFVRPEPRFEALDFKSEAQKRTGRELSPAEVSRFWFRESFSWIKSRPGEALVLLLHKSRLMIHNYEVPDNHSFYLTRSYFVRALWAPFMGFGLLWGPALIGMAILARRDRRAWYPAAFCLLYALSIIPFFIVARYRLAVIPALVIFASGFVAWAVEMVTRKDAVKLGLAGAIIFVSLLLGFIPIRESSWPQSFCSYNIGNAYFDIQEPAAAVFWYDKALEAMPDDPNVIANRTMALAMQDAQRIDALMEEAGKGEKMMARSEGRKEFLNNAFLHLERALEISPQNAPLINTIGNCHFLAGDYKKARTWWEKTLELYPGNVTARRGLKILDGLNGPGQ